MANPFFNAMQRAQGMMPRGGQNPMAMVQQLRSNPVQFLKNMGYNIPKELANNPMGIMQHLAQSNQFNQQQMQQYQQVQQYQQQMQNNTPQAPKEQ